jgi:hypothetical protein
MPLEMSAASPSIPSAMSGAVLTEKSTAIP